MLAKMLEKRYFGMELTEFACFNVVYDNNYKRNLVIITM